MRMGTEKPPRLILLRSEGLDAVIGPFDMCDTTSHRQLGRRQAMSKDVKQMSFDFVHDVMTAVARGGTGWWKGQAMEDHSKVLAAMGP